jgi:hypothetical protein
MKMGDSSGGARNNIKPGHNFNRKCTYIYWYKVFGLGFVHIRPFLTNNIYIIYILK